MTFIEAYNRFKEDTLGTNFTINSVHEADQFHKRFINFRKELLLNCFIDTMPHYRGEQKYGWDILPGIFRPPLLVKNVVDGKVLEKKALIEFERIVKEQMGQDFLRTIYDGYRYGKEWDLLFQAQHAGIKTTLTDWSAEIMSALFFATEKSKNSEIENSNGQLWCVMMPLENIKGNDADIYSLNPFEMNETYLINPSSYITDIENRIFEFRMYHQKGRFIIPSNEFCNIPINHQEGIKEFLFRITIPAERKNDIRNELAQMRITRDYFFINDDLEREELITVVNKKIFPLSPE